MEEIGPVFRESRVGLALIHEDNGELQPFWVNHLGKPEGFMERKGTLWGSTERAFAEAGSRGENNEGIRYILKGEQRIGILVCEEEAEYPAEILTAVAEELSHAAQQLEEISEVNQLSRKIQILNSLAKSLSSALEMDIILTATMQAVWELFNVEAGALVLREDPPSWNLIKHLLTGDLSGRQKLPGENAEGIVGHCVQNSATAVLEEAPKHIHYDPAVDDIEGYETRSLLCVPLLVREKVFGAIELINKISGPFSRSDKELLITLAANVAAAINNVQLFTSLTQANQDLEVSREEISRSRSTLMALFDNLDDELYIVDRKYRVIAINQARARRSHKVPQDMISKKCYKVLFGSNRPCEYCRVLETFNSGEKTMRIEREWETGQIHAEREIFTYPIKDNAGRVLRTILQVRDVTEQRRLEASLIQAEKLAAVGQLAAGVAHELNNPITAVIANVQLMRIEMEQNIDQTESLELIESASLRAQEVVKGLLNFSRQERQEFVLMDVNTSIRQSLSLVQNQWSSSNINLILDLDEHLPLVRGNPDHLQSVWLNLLINAHDALDEEGGIISIKSTAQRDEVEVVVSDTGMGIPPDLIKKIFEPFFTTKEPGRGTGLGLSTTYRIIKNHGGGINIKSQPGQGTTMIVMLPAVPTTA
ncbi:MAG: GAF domain-containing protein [Anaerolineales bacterium]|nr:GAF domain-containing protein [Anaerolineales bacterium]